MNDRFHLINEGTTVYFAYKRGLAFHKSTIIPRVVNAVDRLGFFQAIEVILNSNLAVADKVKSINHIVSRNADMNDVPTVERIQEFVQRTVVAPTTAITGTMLLRWVTFACVVGFLVYWVWNIDSPIQEVHEVYKVVGYAILTVYFVGCISTWESLCEEQGYLGRYYYSIASVKYYLAKWLDGYRF